MPSLTLELDTQHGIFRGWTGGRSPLPDGRRSAHPSWPRNFRSEEIWT